MVLAPLWFWSKSMVILPIIAAAVLVFCFLAILFWVVLFPAPAKVDDDEKPPSAFPGPDLGPWGPR